MAIDKNFIKAVSAVIFAVGMVASAFVLAGAVRDFKGADRYVTVKGLVERDVRADLAIWPLKFRVSGDDLAATQAQALANKDQVMAFMKENGVDEKDIGTSIRVIDRKSQDYGDNRADSARFVIEVSVQVRSSAVDVIVAASQKSGDMVTRGVVLFEDNSCNAGPSYAFTGLNAIKPEMLAEATKNARLAAEQFAADSGAQVGDIRRANQGVFSINERDRVAENSDGGYSCISGTPNKKVRVVTTVDYFLAR